MATFLPDLNFDSGDDDVGPVPPVNEDSRILFEKFADTIFGYAKQELGLAEHCSLE